MCNECSFNSNNKQLLNNHIQEIHLHEIRVVKQNEINSHIMGAHFQTENNLDNLQDEERPIIVTNLYRKDTERPRALLPSSCHPGHISKNIVYGMLFRLTRNCTYETDFLKNYEVRMFYKTLKSCVYFDKLELV